MDSFAIYYYHGGRFASIGGETVYIGGTILRKSGFDADRVGFLELVDDVEKLGYSEVKLFYIVLGLSLNVGLREIKDDREVMEMVKVLNVENALVEVYVQGVNSGKGEKVVP